MGLAKKRLGQLRPSPAQFLTLICCYTRSASALCRLPTGDEEHHVKFRTASRLHSPEALKTNAKWGKGATWCIYLKASDLLIVLLRSITEVLELPVWQCMAYTDGIHQLVMSQALVSIATQSAVREPVV